ncbi:hypothetical protein [Terricaulis sp.]|uniref:hypothetical protein n=1 Tax=Terricaulis sp. TaxID=2768686 RepID=UPI003783F47E
MLTPYFPARLTQYAIAAGFLSFGAVALGAPDFLRALMARPEFQTGYPIVGLAIGALGAHAVAAGLFAAFKRFASWTFIGFGVATLPILAADYWLYAKAATFNDLLFLHVGGIVAMLGLCIRGFRIMQQHEQAFDEQPA